MDGARREAMVLPPALEPSVLTPDSAEQPLIEPPVDMPDREKVVWRALAPLALKERTLTASKVSGFRALCTRWVYCADYDARIWEIGGPARHEAEHLVKRLEKWQPLLGNSLKEFNLTAFGRPASMERPRAVANPFGALQVPK